MVQPTESDNEDTIKDFKRVTSNPPPMASSGSKSAFSMNRCNQIMRHQSNKKRLPSKIDVRVSIIGSGQVVGLEDMSKDESVIVGRHQATVTCISEKGSAYFLSSENFFGFLYRHIKKSHISEQFEAKLPFYNKRVEKVMHVHHQTSMHALNTA